MARDNIVDILLRTEELYQDLIDRLNEHQEIKDIEILL